MTVKYEIKFEKDGHRYFRSEQSVCFGGLPGYTRYFFDQERSNTGNFNYKVYKDASKSLSKAPMFTASDFQGIELLLKENSFYSMQIISLKKLHDDIHNDLLGHLIDDRKVILHHGAHGLVESITYLPSCPTYLMMASASIYRLFDNWSQVLDMWNRPDLQNLKPIVRYALLVSCNLQERYPTSNLFSSKKRLIRTFSIGEHMPWRTDSMNIDNICRLATMDRRNISGWKTLRQQIEDKGGINYAGREKAWCPYDLKDNALNAHLGRCPFLEIAGSRNINNMLEEVKNSTSYWHGGITSACLTWKEWVGLANKTNEAVNEYINSRS